jgi:3-deoxy-D-manno-octulosonic-acid transferase
LDIWIYCGSFFDNIGGHNPYEALKYENIIISGQYVANFEEIYQKLQKNSVCQIVKNENELYFYLLKILKDKKHYQQLEINIEKFLKNQKSVLEQNIQKFKEYINQ